MRVNYTTYDMRRDQDTVNPRTHPDIMVLADDAGTPLCTHPYWYARTLTIFHVKVYYAGSGSSSSEYTDVQVVWVRWFKYDMTRPGGFGTRRLHRISFISSDDAVDEAFGFVDPQDIIRGVHIIPAFAYGRTFDYLGPSAARDFIQTLGDDGYDEDEDWRYYYVNM